MLSADWRALARKYIAYDVFDEMAACFRCDRVRCPDHEYETCPKRLTQAAASKAKSLAQMPNWDGVQESRSGGYSRHSGFHHSTISASD
jgi:hypothetical protein